MGIKHADTKATGEKGYASEWNKNHIVDGDVSFNNKKITSLATPTDPQDGATKDYVDSATGTPPVLSVFGRTGDVVATTNDYTWAKIDKTTSSIADITTRSHTLLADIGTNTHTNIDTHITNYGQNETVAGIKTFSSFPVTPSSAPLTDYQVANKKYVDDTAGAPGVDNNKCGVYRTTSKTVSSHIPYIIDWDAEEYDGNSMHSTITDNSRITIQATGYYLVGCSMAWGNSPNPVDTQLNIIKNGATYMAKALDFFQNRSGWTMSAHKAVYLTAGEYAEVEVEHFTGSDQACCLGGAVSSYFYVARII